MKKALIISSTAAVIAAVVYIAVHQARAQSAQPSQTPPSPSSGGIGFLLVNPLTWEVSSSDGDREKVAGLNTPQQIRARAQATMAILQPARAGDPSGKTPEQLQLEAQARDTILNPTTDPVAWLASKTPEQRAEILKAMEAIQPAPPRN